MDIDLKLYPIEIVQARYAGVYEGGAWLAFPTGRYSRQRANRLAGIPTWYSLAFGSDEVCADFWEHHPLAQEIGRGDTPDHAVADLVARLNVVMIDEREEE